MDKFKFTDFDLFAYVASGLAALLSVDLAFGSHLVLLNVDPGIAHTVLLLIAAYVLGHVVSIPAYILMEQFLLGAILLRPSILLFPDDHHRMLGVVRWLLAAGITDYGQPLDTDTVTRIKARFRAEGRHPRAKDRYWAIYPSIYAPRDKELPSSPRIELFAKLFTFARNLAIVALFHPLVMLAAKFTGAHGIKPPLGLTQPWQFAIAIVLFLALTLRFLKFYDLNAREMFIAYSQGRPDTDARSDDTGFH